MILYIFFSLSFLLQEYQKYRKDTILSKLDTNDMIYFMKFFYNTLLSKCLCNTRNIDSECQGVCAINSTADQRKCLVSTCLYIYIALFIIGYMVMEILLDIIIYV